MLIEVSVVLSCPFPSLSLLLGEVECLFCLVRLEGKTRFILQFPWGVCPKPCRKGSCSDCSVLWFRRWLVHSVLGVSVRKPICSQVSATFYSFCVIICKGEIWSCFPVQNSGWRERGMILFRLLRGPAALLCTGEGCGWGFETVH